MWLFSFSFEGVAAVFTMVFEIVSDIYFLRKRCVWLLFTQNMCEASSVHARWSLFGCCGSLSG